jgi:hypothetical protein
VRLPECVAKAQGVATPLPTNVHLPSACDHKNEVDLGNGLVRTLESADNLARLNAARLPEADGTENFMDSLVATNEIELSDGTGAH